MAKIAIIDDNIEQAETLEIALKHYLEVYNVPFDVIIKFPFKEFDNYFTFIDEENICALILDERLNNQKTELNEPVDYRGNQLVSIIRERFKDFPVFSITTFVDDDELKDKFSEFEYIIRRTEFVEEGEKYIPIIARATQRYLDTNMKELDEYNKVAIEIVSGSQSPDKLERLRALQIKLELPFSGLQERNVWLDKYEQHINELEKLKDKLESE